MLAKDLSYSFLIQTDLICQGSHRNAGRVNGCAVQRSRKVSCFGLRHSWYLLWAQPLADLLNTWHCWAPLQNFWFNGYGVETRICIPNHFQMMLMPLVQAPPVENHWAKWSLLFLANSPVLWFLTVGCHFPNLALIQHLLSLERHHSLLAKASPCFLPLSAPTSHPSAGLVSLAPGPASQLADTYLIMVPN